MKIEIGKYTLTISLSDDITRRKEAAAVWRDKYKTGTADKIQAVKYVRELFLGTDSPLGTLKGAKDFIES